MVVYEMSYKACMDFMDKIGEKVKDPDKCESLIEDFLCGRMTVEEVEEVMA